MKWAGKALGTTVGAMVGGPIGAGVGAVVGHLLADREPKVVIRSLRYEVHASGRQGPGLRVVPSWEAAGLAGEAVRVRVLFGGRRWEDVVEVEADRELCELPERVLPWVELEGVAEAGGREVLRLEIRAPGEDAAVAEFPVEVPGRLRRLSGCGAGREVLAMAGAARAGGRALGTGDVRRIREWMEAAHGLDEAGVGWLRLLLVELKGLEAGRLEAGKAAERAGVRLEVWEQERLLGWLCAGAERQWTGEAARAWIGAFAAGLGLEAPWPDRAPLPRSREQAAALLGVAVDAPEEEQRQAWRKMLQRHHPDRVNGEERAAWATQKTVQLNAAWALLRGG